MEHFLVQHCAPTLAGLKMANLFNCPVASAAELQTYLRQANRHLNAKNVFAEALREGGGRALIFVYRKNILQAALLTEAVSQFLSTYGYDCGSCDSCLARLKERCASSQGFPHEIGVFLGYPLEDVVGFIVNGGKNSKSSGMWKVYGDTQQAEKLFAQYNKCKKIYMKLFSAGQSVTQLTVAV
ncbi:MAG: DUF3793 family protein [Oscillospiraceae bacterium]|jgi:hypothetical protein|nr:DUF3793 family protein [Oscillospiraceae bacterium]